MSYLLTELLPRFQDRRCVVVTQTNQRRHPLGHTPDIAGIAQRVQQCPDLVIGQGGLCQASGCLAKTLQTLTTEVDDRAYRVAMQKLIQFLSRMAGHRVKHGVRPGPVRR